MKTVLATIVHFCLVFQMAGATDVYMVIGQSNGWRLSSLADFPADPTGGEVLYFPMACGNRPETTELQVIRQLHPSCQGLGLAERLLKQAGGADIIFLQYCVCGASLGDEINWYPGEDPAAGVVNDNGLYAKFLKYAANAREQVAALGHDWDVKGVFWHQGEADSNVKAAQYEANFRHLVERLRLDLGDGVPIVAGKIRSLSERAKLVNAALDAVAVSDSNLAVVEVDDLPSESPTDVHFNTEGCHQLGQRLAEAFLELTMSDDGK